MKGNLAVVHRDRVGVPAEARTNALPVQSAMHEMLVNCARPSGEVHEDRVILLQMWTRETAEFEPEIVVESFRYLLRHNPRNPFRPTVQDIVARCEWVRREWADRIERRYVKGSSNETLPDWCARLMHEVLTDQLAKWTAQWTKYPVHPRALSEAEGVAWSIAEHIGTRLADWPTDLLEKFCVPTGGELARLRAKVEAHEEQREVQEREERARREADERERARLGKLTTEAREAALARPDVQAAFTAQQVAIQRGPKSSEYGQAIRAFQDLYRPACNEELKARGLPELSL